MVIRWVFCRGPECSSLTLMRTAVRWVIITRNNAQLRLVPPSLIAAVLLQFECERELVAAGWHLTAVQRRSLPAVPASSYPRRGTTESSCAGVTSPASVFEYVRPAPPDQTRRSKAGSP